MWPLQKMCGECVYARFEVEWKERLQNCWGICAAHLVFSMALFLEGSKTTKITQINRSWNLFEVSLLLCSWLLLGLLYQEPLAWQTFIRHNRDVWLFLTFKGFFERKFLVETQLGFTLKCLKIDDIFVCLSIFPALL